MRTIAVVALVLTQGCAHILGLDTYKMHETKYQGPCIVPLVVVLAKNTNEADNLCRNILGVEMTDSGEKITDAHIIFGCTDGFTVITVDDPETIEHELHHVWDMLCTGEE